jgi:hypothetical protein
MVSQIGAYANRLMHTLHSSSQLQLLRDQLQLHGPYHIYTDGGWEYGGDGMDASFYPYTDSPSHKEGGSIIFITTNLRRIKVNMISSEDQTIKLIDYVVIRNEQGKIVGRVPTHKSYWRY